MFYRYVLFLTHPERTEQFERLGVMFGLQDIVVMKTKEGERVTTGWLKFMRGLLDSFIERDS